jgi:four helix bundle protein
MDRAHKKLDVWKESVDLAVEIYRVTEAFPKSELYSLTSQMRRAAVSVPSNIAEGAARSTGKEFMQFLMIARGSLSELAAILIMAAVNFWESERPARFWEKQGKRERDARSPSEETLYHRP